MYILKCEEISLNTSRLTFYSFFNVFIFVPRAKAFIFFYHTVRYIYKTRKINNDIFYFFNILFFIACGYLIKMSILLIVGYSYITLMVTSNFVIKYFDILRWKYEDSTAKYQHILFNCFISDCESISDANDMRVIIKNNELVFNPKCYLKNLYKN